MRNGGGVTRIHTSLPLLAEQIEKLGLAGNKIFFFPLRTATIPLPSVFKPISSSALWGRLVGGSDRRMIGASHPATYLLWFCILSLPACLHAHTPLWLQAPFILLVHRWKATLCGSELWHSCRRKLKAVFSLAPLSKMTMKPREAADVHRDHDLRVSLHFRLCLPSGAARSSWQTYSNKRLKFELWLIS